MAIVTLKLLPSQYKFIASRKKEVLYSGSYGCGKSKAICLAIAKQATIPGNVCLLVRKTLTSLKRSTLLTLISGNDAILPKNSFTMNNAESKITLNGGGVIYLMGIDDPTRIRSINAGCIALDEAIEFSEAEYLELLGRLRAKEGCRQIYLATNPATPSHWMYKRFFLEKNKDREVISAKTYENTHLPQDYIDSLKELPSIMYKRFVEGQWCATDRAIYNEFSRDFHVKKIHEGLQFSDYLIGVDMGYTHPAAVVMAGTLGDRLYVLKTWRKSKQLMDKISDVIQEFSNGLPMKPTVIVDPSAATLIAQLEADGHTVNKANNDVDGGINRIRQRLVVRNDSPDLIIDDNCQDLVSEMENYQYQEGTEKPVKVGDDLCFIAGTKVLTNKGYKSIEDIRIDDEVFDGKVYNRVTHSNNTGNKDVVLYRLNNRFLIGTNNHPIYVNDKKIPIGELCKLYKYRQEKELLKKLNLTEESTEDIYITVVENTSPADRTELMEIQGAYTEIFGLKRMVEYLRDMQYTIKILTIQTILCLILSFYQKKNTCHSILRNITKNILTSLKRILRLAKINVEIGIDQKKEDSGILSMEKYSVTEPKSLLNAHTVENLPNMTAYAQGGRETTSVHLIVGQLGVGKTEEIILKLYVLYAQTLSSRTNTQRLSTAQESVQEKLELVESINIANLPVYNITVENSHRYTANNILVSNCDSLRYIVNSVDDTSASYVKPMIYAGEEENE